MGRSGDRPEEGGEPVIAPKLVGAVVNAIDILKYLADAKGPLGVTYIARDLKINPSTCFNILRTLATYRMVDFDAATRTYRIGLGVVGLARGAFEADRAAETIRSAMAEVAVRHAVTATLWRRTSHARMTLIAVAENQAAISIRMNLGHRLPILAGALGRIMAGFNSFPPEELRRLYDEVIWQSPPGFELFMEEARLARERGWSVDAGNLVRGALTIAVPVPSPRSEQIDVTVNASMFERQHSKKTIAEIAADLKDVAALMRHLPAP